MDGYAEVAGRANFEPVMVAHENPEVLAKALPHVQVHASHRGFLTITGTYKGVPISIISIGMG